MYVSTSRYVRPAAHVYAALWNPSLVCQATTTVIVVVNYLVLSGWMLDIELLKNSLSIAASPLPSLSMALLAMSIFLFHKSRANHQVQVLGLIMLAAGLALFWTSSRYLSGNVTAWLMLAGLLTAALTCIQTTWQKAGDEIEEEI